MESSPRLKPIVVGVAVAAVIAACVYAFVRPGEGWPSESRRLVNGAGFSVVSPEDYEQDVQTVAGPSGSLIRLLSKSKVGNPTLFSAAQIAPASESSLRSKGFDATAFQGRPAWDHVRDLPKTHEHLRTLVFERDGQWYELNARVPAVDPLDSGVWAGYFDTFRTEPKQSPVSRKAVAPDLVDPPAAPATRPAGTSPSATSPAATRP